MRSGTAACLLAILCASSIVPAGEPKDEPPAFLVWPPYMKHKNIPAPGVFAGIEGESRFETNGLGIRGPDWGDARKKEYRILFVGGSATECFYLDQDEAWPALVGLRLPKTADGRRIWAGNIGKSGHNSRDHLMEMRRLLPDLSVDAVVMMVGLNDLGMRLAYDTAFNPDFLASDENVKYQIGHAFAVHPDDPNLPFYRKGAVGRLLGLDPDAAKRKPHQVVDNAGLVFLKWREYRKAGPILPALPDLGAALGEYARNVEAIATEAKQLGVRLVFVTQPALWRADLGEAESSTLWMGGIGDFVEKPGASYYAPGALAEGLAAYNRTLMEACARSGAECLDLAPKIRRDLSSFYDDCHFNEGGARAVADEIVRYLSERPPFAGK